MLFGHSPASCVEFAHGTDRPSPPTHGCLLIAEAVAAEKAADAEAAEGGPMDADEEEEDDEGGDGERDSFSGRHGPAVISVATSHDGCVASAVHVPAVPARGSP